MSKEIDPVIRQGLMKSESPSLGIGNYTMHCIPSCPVYTLTPFSSINYLLIILPERTWFVYKVVHMTTRICQMSHLVARAFT